MRPVAAGADAGDVAEVVRFVHLGEVFGGERLTGLRSIDVEADRTLVERLDHVVAIGIEDFPELEFVKDVAFRIHFDDEVAHRMDALVVEATQVGRRDAKERMAVLRLVDGVRIVGIAERQTTAEEFAAEQVVLDVALTVTPGERAVGGLLEAHHDAGLVRLFLIEHVFVRKEVPADFARRVDDGVFRVVLPFERAARRIVPNHAGAVGGWRTRC